MKMPEVSLGGVGVGGTLVSWVLHIYVLNRTKIYNENVSVKKCLMIACYIFLLNNDY